MVDSDALPHPSAPDTRLLTKPVAVGDQFVYTTPSGRQHTYTVTELDVTTRQGHRLPRATAEGCNDVYVTDELLDQEWWQRV